MLSKLHILVMAGGSGTRFWPRSRRDFPKQFLSITGERTLIEETVERVRDISAPDRLWILTRDDLVDTAGRLLPDIPKNRIVAEPELRDTASALTFAASLVEQVDPDATLLVLPADHLIPDAQAFCDCVRGAVESLEERDGLVTFGIPPTSPETVYGYIERGGDAVSAGGSFNFAVEQFVEKPDLRKAQEYVASGRHYWNGGIFLWKIPVFKEALRQHAPEYIAGWDALSDLGPELFERGSPTVAERFALLPKNSIDYALMEKADGVRVVEATFPWDDVGSWRALERHRALDADGNLQEGRVVHAECKRSTIFASGDRVVAALGLEDLVVIDTPDALLVCPRDRVDEVKKLVQEIASHDWEDVL
ncbi:MAG: mannose-1-phosphate guanylyltransferase [Planctomycetota bacterium]